MTRKEWFGFVVILAVCAFFCGMYWFVSEGRFASSRQAPVATLAAPTLAPALLPPSQATSAIVTSVSAPVGLSAIVPNLKEPVKVMKGTGRVRVVLEFEKEQADKVTGLFVKGGTYYVTVVK